MSHYTTIKTEITDRDCLVEALVAVGFERSHIEIHEVPVHLYGYQGEKRDETAQIVIRKEHVGTASNDIGFKLQPDGTYRAIISEFDRGYDGHGKYGKPWLDRLTQEYAKAKVVKTAASQGFVIGQQTVSDDGRVHFTLTRTATGMIR